MSSEVSVSLQDILFKADFTPEFGADTDKGFVKFISDVFADEAASGGDADDEVVVVFVEVCTEMVTDDFDGSPGDEFEFEMRGPGLAEVIVPF